MEEGDLLKQPELSKTLEKIANEGPDYFYNSDFTNELVKELQEDGSTLTVEDFQTYEVKIREVIVTDYGNLKVHGIPLPGGGPITALILNILDGKILTEPLWYCTMITVAVFLAYRLQYYC